MLSKRSAVRFVDSGFLIRPVNGVGPNAANLTDIAVLSDTYVYEFEPLRLNYLDFSLRSKG
jgi:hypothetical protein